MGDARRDARLLWELDVEGIGGQMIVADVNGDGNRVIEFPFREDFKQPKQRIRGFRAYDYGIGYGAMVLDLDGMVVMRC